MIKRHYFISGEKPHCDGSGSYSFHSMTASWESWFPQPLLVFSDMSERLEESMLAKKGSAVQVVAFNRI